MNGTNERKGSDGSSEKSGTKGNTGDYCFKTKLTQVRFKINKKQ